MTSKGCTKSYNRKVNNGITSGSIQFDKLFRENSNRPSAAKSAGTVGKWGITSFTSIRSTNINGRRSGESRGSFGSKRMKLDYGNQNSHKKETFSYTKPEEEPKAPVNVNKPKKFFKSRNTAAAAAAAAAAASTADTRADKETCQSISDTQLNYDRGQKRRSSDLSCTKQNERGLDTVTDTSCRDEGKPPIVLRICKGTARLISSEETESDTYRVSTPPPISKPSTERKSSNQNVKLDIKSNSIESNNLTSSASTLDEKEMRTTRSRAKTLRHDTSSTVAPPAVTPNSGISLTLRKSVSDSNNTFVSHYDIVKTDCTSSNSEKSDEVLISQNQPLPRSTQELIDILSNDSEPVQNNLTNQDNSDNNKELENLNHNTDKNLKEPEAQEESNYEDLKVNSPPNEAIAEKKMDTEIDQNLAYMSSNKNDSLLLSKENKDVTIKNLDQEWFSGSDDSESASGNLQSELQSESQCLINNTAPSADPINKIIDKPVSRKGSIFKTRSAGATNGNKRRALYKHKWSDSDKEVKTTDANISAPSTSSTATADSNVVAFDEEFEDSPLTRIVSYPETGTDLSDDLDNVVTSIRCGKRVKGFYTVVKNVKKAHQIQESGEFQEFNDDVEYILDTLRENNPNATRCLSAIRLASKCMAPAFRMHVRAHGTVAKFFKALHDATTDQSLALCTATVMFVLSQDRLAMDLDRDCLELMLSLLESDASHKDALDDCGLSHAELLKNKEKVRQLCADIQAQGHAKHLNLDNITVGQLAMETLLSLTSKRAGEWFKEELRELGGLEHIIKTITECHRHIYSSEIPVNGWNEPLLDQLRKVDRCLRVLENVTHMNEENQVYLLKYNDSILVITLARLYNFCGQEIMKYPTVDTSDKTSNGAVIRECLFAIIKVLINLTHRFNRQSFGGKTVGHQDRVIDNSLHLILHVPQYLPEEKRFDVMMLALILLINLIEQCEENKKLLIASKVSPDGGLDGQGSGLNALVNLFYKQEELARAEERKTDAILDGKKDSEQPETVSTTSKTQEEFIEETVAKLLQKAGRHMEHTLIAAYVVLLLGYLIMDNKAYEKLVRTELPDGTFVTMVAVLQKFFNFMNLTASNELSSCGIAATEKVIKFLKTSDESLTEEEKSDAKSTSEDANPITDNCLP